MVVGPAHSAAPNLWLYCPTKEDAVLWQNKFSYNYRTFYAFDFTSFQIIDQTVCLLLEHFSTKS